MALFAAVLAVYAPALTYSPPSLHEAEALFGLHAHAIASTAHDLDGRFLPLYFQMQPIGDNVWFHPAIVYFTALFFQVLPFSEWAIRFPSTVVAAIDVVLLYLIAARFFKERWQAVLAATLLAMTPAHFVNGRIATDYVYPIPFVLGWMLCLLSYLEKRRTSVLVLGGTILGVGFYSYIASVIMMPLYLVFTWLMLFLSIEKPARPCLIATAGFAWPLTLLPLWFYSHPEMLSQTLARYGVPEADLLVDFGNKPLADILEELRRPLRFTGLTGRVSLYWYFFDPSFLFLTGGYANMVNSTRRVGVFLFPFFVLLPVGLWRVASELKRPLNVLLLLGFFTAPLAACLVVPEPYAIDREMTILPFGVLLATAGIASLWDSGARWRRAARALVVIAVCHFGFLLFDYFGEYRGRAAPWFNRNHPGAIAEILKRETDEDSRPIYLSRSRDDRYIEVYWRLALEKHRRQALLKRTVYYEDRTFDLTAVPAGSLLLSSTEDSRVNALVAEGALHRLVQIPEPSAEPYFSILQK